MKVRELIRQLQELDPTGEIEVIGWAGDIYFAERMSDYYDGHPLLLIRDDSLKPYYDIVGMQIGSPTGEDKIVLHEMDLKDVLLDNPDLKVIINTGSSHSNDRYQKMVDEARAEMKAIIDRVEAPSKERKNAAN